MHRGVSSWARPRPADHRERARRDRGRHRDAALRRFGRRLGVGAFLGTLLGVQALVFVAVTTAPASATADPVLMAAGDIGCDPTTQSASGCAMNDTAALINSAKPGYLLALGDVQYTDNLPQGTPPPLSYYQQGYDTAWGQIPVSVPGVSINPTAGNHDWGDPNDTNSSSGGTLANYMSYFSSKGELRSGVSTSTPWYSFDIPVNGGSWHVIVLDNECGSDGGCGSGSPQETFLRNDLAAHPNVCSIAAWHRPRFSSGDLGNQSDYAQFWTDLYNAHASIALAGSDHDYERFNPQTPSQAASSVGIAQYIVGTGGAFLPGNFGTTQPNSAFQDANDYGVLSLTLHASSYDHAFVTPNGTIDTGTVNCSSTPGAAPVVSGVSPTSGPAGGGNTVTITGSNFTGATAVKFGTAAGTSLVVNSSTQMTVKAAAGTQNTTVDVTVTTPNGTSAVNPSDHYLYQGTQPQVSGVSPTSGPAAGGTQVTLSGSNFTGATAVRFGTVLATSFWVASSTQINAVSPAGTDQTAVHVTVTTPQGTSAATGSDLFGYGITTPTVASVTPISGASGGGTSVGIAGSGFVGVSAVNFGTTPATSFTVNSAGSITATAPAGTAALVDVTVTNAAGTSGTSPADQWSWTYSNNGYSAAIAASATNPAVGGSVNLTATVNKDTGPSPYYITIEDVTTNTQVGSQPSGTTFTIAVSQAAASTHRYMSCVCGQNFATPQAVSTPVVVTWGSTTPPSVTGVSPSSGSTAGGTPVTISGANFTGATAVKFGAAAATSFTVNGATSISATSPAGAAGTVHVGVTTAAGTSTPVAADQFTYAAPVPTVTGVSPATGSAAGGTLVTITGTNFTGATAVRFGSAGATGVTVNNAGSISVTSPAGAAGTVDVSVTTPSGTSVTGTADQFTYVTPPPPPTVTGVSPVSGTTAGGTPVTISGTNFTGATTVKFGTTAATGVTVNNAGSISVTSPAGAAGTVDVSVTTPGGTSGTGTADHYTWVTPPPAITGVSPAGGSTSGGTTVTISGNAFTGATAVRFGATAATSFSVGSASSISATSPAGAAGTVDVSVTTPAGTSTPVAADQFAYAAPPPPPAVTGVSPVSGTTTGGTTVTISGTNITGATGVKFGAASATSFTVNGAGSIWATSPAGSPGTVHITVTTPGGTSVTGTADQYTYVPPPPAVTGVSPSSGATGGGTAVTILGSNLSGATAVRFGTTPAASFSVVSGGQVSAVSPAGANQTTVDITVTTPSGTSATGSADRFTFGVTAPSVTGVSPISGVSTGGTAVSISGTGFTGVTGVSFGSSAAAGYTVNNAGSITATAPAGGANLVDVTVTNAAGTSPTSVADQYSWQLTSGTYAVTLAASATNPAPGAGVNLTATSNHDVGPTPYYLTVVDVTTETQIGEAPSGTTLTISVSQASATSHRYLGYIGGQNMATPQANSVPVVVTWGNLTPPAVTSVSPSSGSAAGGTTVTMGGNGFTGATAVRFGSVAAASFTVNGATSISATSPAGAVGLVDVTVTTPAGTSTTGTGDQFTYTAPPAPAVTGVSPASGSTAGGASVVISGTNLSGATAVSFGGSAAASYAVNNPGQITAVSPAGSAGAVHVAVTTAGGTSAPGTADQFAYVAAPPSVTGVSPASGPAAGGTAVTINGSGFTGATAVQFGTTPAAGFSVVSGSQISAVSPAGANQTTVDLTVAGPSGTSPTGAADRFTWGVTAPAVTGVTPISGPSGGGTSVAIAGTGFVGVTAVNFGTVAATGFTVNSATSITATAPAGTANLVDVTVVTGAGTSPTSAADQYSWTFSTNGFAVSLSSSATSASVGASVNLTATSTRDVGPTPYYLTIIDVTTETQVGVTPSGTTLTIPVSQSAATSHRYTAYIGGQNLATPQANSAPIVVTWH